MYKINTHNISGLSSYVVIPTEGIMGYVVPIYTDFLHAKAFQVIPWFSLPKAFLKSMNYGVSDGRHSTGCFDVTRKLFKYYAT